MTKYFNAFIKTAKLSLYIYNECLNSDDVHEVIGLKDALTGLWNRKYWNYYISKNASSIESIMILDLDFFKEINDTLGHTAGDERLIKMADFLKTIKHVEAFRYGGDEFILVPHTKRVAGKVARHIKYNVKNACGLSVSIGIGRTFDEADKALYMSKAVEGKGYYTDLIS